MFLIEPSKEIRTRNGFGALCSKRGLWRAVEVGVDLGEFAYQFLSTWDGRNRVDAILWCVDPYLPYPHMGWNRESDMHIALGMMSRFPGRARLIRANSLDGAKLLSGRLMEFVYIDAEHDYANTAADIRAWWPTLRTGGVSSILAGHDFDDEHHPVKGAVIDFAREHNLRIQFTADPDNAPSWYIYKEEPTDVVVAEA